MSNRDHHDGRPKADDLPRKTAPCESRIEEPLSWSVAAAAGGGSGPMLRRGEVLRRTTFSSSKLHALGKEGRCPPLVSIGESRGCARGVREAVLDAWLESRLEARSQMRCLEDPVEVPVWEPRARSGDHPVGIVLIRRPEVLRRVGCGKTKLYDMIHGPERFPWPAALSARVRGWAVHEVEAWLAVREERAAEEQREVLRRQSLAEMCKKELDRRDREQDRPPPGE